VTLYQSIVKPCNHDCLVDKTSNETKIASFVRIRGSLIGFAQDTILRSSNASVVISKVFCVTAAGPCIRLSARSARV
jgi:hypothetical protein